MSPEGGSRSWLRSAVEVLGLVAVVVSLVFVGLELRETNRAVRANTYMAMSDATWMFLTSAMENPEIQTSTTLWAGEAEEILREETYRAQARAFALLRHWENAHRQHELGILTEAEVHRLLGATDWLRSRPFREYWKALSEPNPLAPAGYFSPDFVEFFSAHLQRLPESPDNEPFRQRADELVEELAR